jgi:hypothetical protein
MKIAFTMAHERGEIDRLLAGLANRLLAAGSRICGTIQTNSERGDLGPCDMDIKVLPDGPVIRISQSLGVASQGCRLDPGALETAVHLVEQSMTTGCDLLLVNKFGKHEAEGRGFRNVIAEAMVREIPVLVGLNPLNREAFQDFTGGLAEELPPDEAVLLDWLGFGAVGTLRPVKRSGTLAPNGA